MHLIQRRETDVWIADGGPFTLTPSAGYRSLGCRHLGCRLVGVLGFCSFGVLEFRCFGALGKPFTSQIVGLTIRTSISDLRYPISDLQFPA